MFSPLLAPTRVARCGTPVLLQVKSFVFVLVTANTTMGHKILIWFLLVSSVVPNRIPWNAPLIAAQQPKEPEDPRTPTTHEPSIMKRQLAGEQRPWNGWRVTDGLSA